MTFDLFVLFNEETGVLLMGILLMSWDSLTLVRWLSVGVTHFEESVGKMNFELLHYDLGALKSLVIRVLRKANWSTLSP